MHFLGDCFGLMTNNSTTRYSDYSEHILESQPKTATSTYDNLSVADCVKYA